MFTSYMFSSSLFIFLISSLFTLFDCEAKTEDVKFLSSVKKVHLRSVLPNIRTLTLYSSLQIFLLCWHTWWGNSHLWMFWKLTQTLVLKVRGIWHISTQYWDFLTLSRRAVDGTSTHSSSKTPSTVRIVFLVLSLRFIVFFIGSNHAERVQGFNKVNNKYRKFLFYSTSEHLRKYPENKAD